MEKRTAILLIPSIVSYHALATLEMHAIPCTYLGVDSSGRIKMKIEYEPIQEALIEELIVSTRRSNQDIAALINLSVLMILQYKQEVCKN